MLSQEGRWSDRSGFNREPGVHGGGLGERQWGNSEGQVSVIRPPLGGLTSA